MGAQSGVLDLGAADGKKDGKKAQETSTSEKALSPQQWREVSKKMSALERKIEKLDAQAEALEAEITAMSGEAAPDFEAIGVKSGELSQLRDQREELEMEWLELGEQLEA